MPSIWVIQVTGMPRPLHHHHFVIGQMAQVGEGQISQLNVLVAVDDQRWNLSEQNAKTILAFKIKDLHQIYHRLNGV